VASGHFDAYDFPDPELMLAVMAASHAGEDRHVRLVQTALRAGGLTRAVLQCGTHAPFDTETARRLARDGEPPTELRHNCSGKHAAMALHAKAAGWEVDTYWQPDHPVQQGALATMAALTGVPARQIGTATDGCGVVSFALPLRAAALAFALSIDDYVITSFNAGQTSTFPLWVFGASRRGIPPQVNVMGTIIFAVGVGLALMNVALQRRRT